MSSQPYGSGATRHIRVASEALRSNRPFLGACQENPTSLFWTNSRRVPLAFLAGSGFILPPRLTPSKACFRVLKH